MKKELNKYRFSKRKLIIILLVTFTIVYFGKLYLKHEDVENIDDTCLVNDFKSKFEDFENASLNTEFNFSQMFQCEDWDEIIFVQAPYVYRPLVYAASCVLLPPFDYMEHSEGTYFVFFLSNGYVVNEPILFGHSKFFFSQNLNYFGYLKLKRDRAVFVYEKFENDDFELFTLVHAPK